MLLSTFQLYAILRRATMQCSKHCYVVSTDTLVHFVIIAYLVFFLTHGLCVLFCLKRGFLHHWACSLTFLVIASNVIGFVILLAVFGSLLSFLLRLSVSCWHCSAPSRMLFSSLSYIRRWITVGLGRDAVLTLHFWVDSVIVTNL